MATGDSERERERETVCGTLKDVCTMVRYLSCGLFCFDLARETERPCGVTGARLQTTPNDARRIANDAGSSN